MKNWLIKLIGLIKLNKKGLIELTKLNKNGVIRLIELIKLNS